MYVLGKSDYDFIKITRNNTLYDGHNLWNEVRSLEYGAPLYQATITPNYEDAQKLLEEIQNNVEKIKFANDNIIGEIIDKENSFDKVAYAKELKIYELIPMEVKR